MSNFVKYALIGAGAVFALMIVGNMMNNHTAQQCVVTETSGQFETLKNGCDHVITARVCTTHLFGSERCGTDDFSPGESLRVGASDDAGFLVSVLSPMNTTWMACDQGYYPVPSDGGDLKYSCKA